MNSNCRNFLKNFMLMVFLNSSSLLVNSQLNTNIGGCTQVHPTEGNSLYYHSEVFAATARPKDVEAFKYYCTNDLIFSTIEDLVSLRVFSVGGESRVQRAMALKFFIEIQFLHYKKLT